MMETLRRPSEEELDVMFPCQGKAGGMDAGREDVWRAPTGNADARNPNIGDL